MNLGSQDLGPQKVALITGATGGLGLSTAKYLVSKGWHVFASDCNTEALDKLNEEENITPLFMDVSKSESVKEAYQQLIEKIKRLDAIVNFAGVLRVGSMAEMEEETLKLVMEINVMGTYRVNRTFLPLLLSQTNASNQNKQSQGRIVNISSETGWQSGAPFNGAYAMSKHAVEAYSDSLRRELMFLDIPVIKIQPGPFKTNMVKSIEHNFSLAEASSTLFKKQLYRVKRLAMHEHDKANNPKLLAQTIHKALSSPRPKAAYSVKPDKLRASMDYFPTKWVDNLMKILLQL
jgi:NAD(P)-dependent dehydrogenase (short-subunit alcohol dehydrogenase family)